LISSGVAGATPLDVQEAAVEDEDEAATVFNDYSNSKSVIIGYVAK
jgi:hypothetical protein